MIIKNEGNLCESISKKEYGVVTSDESVHCGTNKYGMHEKNCNLRDIGFKAGRTIELAPFEFCRIDISLSMSIIEGIDRLCAYDALDEWVNEFLKLEEHGVKGSKYEPLVSDESYDIINKCICRRIYIGYGLTLKDPNNKMESHRIDILEEVPVSDGDSISDSFRVLSDELAKQLSNHHDRIKNAKKD